MFNFTGSEKAAVALTPLMGPLTIILTALLALGGLGEMPSSDLLAQSVAFSVLTIVGARLVWQVPNTTPEQVKEQKAIVRAEEVADAVADKKIEKIQENPTE